MPVILKVINGFLNADGGNIYIGVKDDGTIVGIEDDLKALSINVDKYQRIIRQHIVDAFNKYISGTINISIIRKEGKDICQINVPSHFEPIAYKNAFFQRQGNETRMIEGNDLIPFIQRKNKTR